MNEETLTVDAERVVTFHYKLSDEQGNLIESSEGHEPVVYLHGRANIVPGLEQQMVGKRSGDKFDATVPPEQAYGLRDENAVQRVPIKHLVTKGRIVPGQMVGVNTREGVRHARVAKVGHFNVDLDLNHPLAGRTLVFSIDIVEVRAATPEELEHGHAHGPAGHAHDDDHGDAHGHAHGHDHDHAHDHDHEPRG